MRFNFRLQSSHIFILFIFFTIISFSFLGYFLYVNFYQALAMPNPLYPSSTDIALQRIDTKLFNTVTAEIEKKKAGENIDWAKMKNPFLPY